jgi:hypothetical protein
MSTLMAVNQQWKNRPEDECFPDLVSAHAAALTHFHNSIEKADVNPSTLRTEASEGEVVLVGKGNTPAHLTHWAFGQLSSLIGAPASYLRRLPATLAVQNLNHGLKSKYSNDLGECGKIATVCGNSDTLENRVNLLLRTNGELTVRSINSDIYSRIWNYELLAKCLEISVDGWTNPRPFNQGAQVGTVWVSDHDMFVFQVNESNLIRVPNENRYLRRGYIMANSEVGGGKWRTMSFLFDYMCCNRMIWGATQVNEIAVRHVGSLADRMGYIFQRFAIDARRYAESSGQTEESKIAKAISTVIADTKDGVIDKVFKLLRGDISRKAITSGYETAAQIPDTSAGPNTVWGLTNGLTRFSQSIPYQDERVTVDRAAGKLIELAQSAF